MLPRLLGKMTEHAYALLRFIVGAMFAVHGAQKIFGVLGAKQPPLFSQIWFGGLIELVAGAAVAVGYLTVWAAFLASGTMAVAYVQFHWKLQGGAAVLPQVNKGELAALYAIVFLFIACKGGGRFSIGRDR